MAATPQGQARPDSPDQEPSLPPQLTETDRPGRALTSAVADAVGPLGSTLPLPDYTVRIEDGLLMVFGPDGDPVPPAAFGAALNEQPNGRLLLPDGTAVPSARVLAVLEAQAGRPLAPAEGDSEAWICAMLGLGPEPDQVEPGSPDEPDGGQVTLFGKELMITLPTGESLLITEANPERPNDQAIGLFRADGTVLSVGELIAEMRPPAIDPQAASKGHDDPPADECALPECWIEVEADALAIDLPALGRVRLAPFAESTSDAPQVTVFQSDGQPTTITDLLAALAPGQSEPVVGESGWPEDEEHPPGSPSGEQNGDLRPVDELHSLVADEETSDSYPTADLAVGWADPPDPVIPLSAHLIRPEGIDPEGIALAVVRGLPLGAKLSAGVNDGEGVWLLAGSEVEDLKLTLPADALRPQSLGLTAIALTSREGALTSINGTLRLSVTPSFGRKEFGRRVTPSTAPQPIPLNVEERLGDLGGLDAVVIRDVPAGAKLSAGTFEPAIAGWVLLPAQIRDLAVTPPPAQASEFTLTVLGISLRAHGTGRPRVLGKLSVAQQ